MRPTIAVKPLAIPAGSSVACFGVYLALSQLRPGFDFADLLPFSVGYCLAVGALSLPCRGLSWAWRPRVKVVVALLVAGYAAYIWSLMFLAFQGVLDLIFALTYPMFGYWLAAGFAGLLLAVYVPTLGPLPTLALRLSRFWVIAIVAPVSFVIWAIVLLALFIP